MKKVRCDFSAHTSVVVAIPDDADYDDAAKIAEEYMQTNSITPIWELDDEGVDDADDSEEAVNKIEDE